MVKNAPAVQETGIRSLCWEDSPGGENGNPLQYSCLEKPCGQRSLAGCSLWGCKGPDTTEHSKHRKQVVLEGSECPSPGTEPDQHLKGMR